MKKLQNYHHYLYLALRISLGLDVFFRTKGNILQSLGFLSLFALIIINDRFRWKKFYKNTKHFYISFLISMIIGFYIALSLGGYMDIYLFVMLYELILYTEGKISKSFITLQIGLIMALLLARVSEYEDIFSFEFWRSGLLDLMLYFISILFYSLLLYTYKTLGKEKRNVDKLNKELDLSYNKLKEQSEKLEELTIAKERNRVAGEIHDNLGHGLIALNMNLDVAGKIIDQDIERAKRLIEKSQELTKASMEDLRKAVYALKEERPIGFKTSIEEIIHNIESSGSVLVSSVIPEATEQLVPIYKEIIYFTIKEALTNSIKHGKASEISIIMGIKEDIRLTIKDNGIGSKNLIKGNGLLGIENRVAKYKGDIKLINEINIGFTLELILPIT